MPHPHAIPDEELMARYQASLDADAFDALVARFLRPMLAVARQILGDAALAEDAVQEAFLRIVRRREFYDPAKRFSTWFYTILRNVCTDMLRSRAKQNGLLQEAAARRASATHEPVLEAMDAFDMLAALPQQQRAVLTLRVVQGLAFAEIATALGISEEAAKKRAQRALRRLREQQAALAVD